MATSKAAPKKTLTKNGLITAIAEQIGEEVTRKQVKAILESLVDVAHKELKKTKVFTLPGFAKFQVKEKPAQKAGEYWNAFRKQMEHRDAKPKSKTVRARPIKAIKDAMIKG